MPARTPRLLLPVVLLGALCACAADDVTTDDGAEQEQAIVAAKQAADSAATPPEGGTLEAAPPPLECDATQVQGLVGQVLDEATAEQARSDAGAKTVRVLEPGQMVTMEFDGERLNIEVDDKRTVTALRCG